MNEEELKKKVFSKLGSELSAAEAYCKMQNGLPYCKNCGLQFDALIDLLKELNPSNYLSKQKVKEIIVEAYSKGYEYSDYSDDDIKWDTKEDIKELYKKYGLDKETK